MTQEQLMAILIPSLAGPFGVAVMGWWIKSTLNKVSHVPDILIELRYMKEKQTEMKVILEKLSDTRDDVIVLKRDMSTQWKRFDELRDKMEKSPCLLKN